MRPGQGPGQFRQAPDGTMPQPPRRATTQPTRSRTASEAKTIAEPSGAPGSGVARPEHRRRAVARGVQARRSPTPSGAQHPAGGVGDQPALGAEVGQHEPRGVERRLGARGQRLVRALCRRRRTCRTRRRRGRSPRRRRDSQKPLNRSTVATSASAGTPIRPASSVERVRPHPGAGGEVRGRVALGHRDRGQPAALAGVEDEPRRDPLGRLRHDPAEPVVGQRLVGVALAVRVDHQAGAEAERERPAAVRLLEPGAEPADAAVVGGRADRDRRPRSARRCWCRPAPSSRPRRRARRARRARRRCPRSRRPRSARRGGRGSRPAPRASSRRRPPTRSPSSDQPGHRQLGQHGAAVAQEPVEQPGDQRLTAAERVAAALAGPVPLDRRPDQRRRPARAGRRA